MWDNLTQPPSWPNIYHYHHTLVEPPQPKLASPPPPPTSSISGQHNHPAWDHPSWTWQTGPGVHTQASWTACNWGQRLAGCPQGMETGRWTRRKSQREVRGENRAARGDGRRVRVQARQTPRWNKVDTHPPHFSLPTHLYTSYPTSRHQLPTSNAHPKLQQQIYEGYGMLYRPP